MRDLSTETSCFNNDKNKLIMGNSEMLPHGDDIEIILLQSLCRGHLCRQAFAKSFRDEFARHFMEDNAKPTNIILLKYGLIIAVKAEYQNDIEYLLPLCEQLTQSMFSTSKSTSFAALFLSTQFIKRSTGLITRLCKVLPSKISSIDLHKITSVRLASATAKFLYTFTECSEWRFSGLNASVLPILETMCIKMSTAFMANEQTLLEISKVINDGLMEIQPVFVYNVIEMFFIVVLRIFKRHVIIGDDGVCCKTANLCRNFLTCPALIYALSTKTCEELKSEKLFSKIIQWLVKNQTELNDFTETKSLNLLANFVHLSYFEHETIVEHLFDWTSIINFFLVKCQNQTKRRTTRNWHHPILGWTSERIDEGTQGTFERIALQLSYLWNRRIVACLFGKVLNSFKADLPVPVKVSDFNLSMNTGFLAEGTLPAEIVQKVLSKLTLRNQAIDVTNSRRSLPPISMTAVVCQLYQNALITFTNTQIEILSGICRNDSILLRLWHFVNNHNGGGLNAYMTLLASDPTVSLPHFSPLHLFADTAYSLISILDEKEMYESDRPFTVYQLREIARFTNIFCFKVIWEGMIDLNERRPSALFQSIFQLCMILYNRDCRRSFSAPVKDFWIVPSASFFSHSSDSSGSTAMVKRAQLISDFERHQPRAQTLMSKMPHVVSLRDRMLLFRKFITREKERLNATHPTMPAGPFASFPSAAAVITVERQRIVEDGYRQLASLSPDALRGTIRVKFINQQGLDEAGIDQDGVFKEFLELTLKKVFDPELNLFKMTSNGLLYPSSTSSVHENHLALFQFVGRMLAKAIFEGICVDVHLAPVLLATVLGKQLCPFDELATLDPMLYRNLMYVKHYNDTDDVRDLLLTFSYNEDFLGKMKTYELIVGGQDIEVNNENKIVYIHKMAQFRVIKQTKEQCEHFVSGFRSILNPKWLSLFSTHELQYLISGHTSDIDLEDLRKHTQYYGGFHGNHRVVKWLWSILYNDFTAEERRLFLKFVTSCSRAPLLGFAYLEPPFSIRCVETSDDMDQGDTLGSIVRGFLAIKRKQPITRLPTASTCFNLLKLPNYNKRSILLEKLRYAIHAETGFELS